MHHERTYSRRGADDVNVACVVTLCRLRRRKWTNNSTAFLRKSSFDVGGEGNNNFTSSHNSVFVRQQPIEKTP